MPECIACPIGKDRQHASHDCSSEDQQLTMNNAHHLTGYTWLSKDYSF
jgi:hypothetical protein